jgi:PqqD family protein of HPr-rel-A system
MNNGNSPHRPVRKETVDFRVLDDLSSVVADPETGEVHAFNAVATAVFERCDGSMTATEIVAEVVEIFDVPSEQVAVDVEDFISDLTERGLVN